jgi:hypothetical protein
MKSMGIEDVTSCSVVEEYNKLLEGTYCLHLQGLEESRCLFASAINNTKRQQTEWQWTYNANIVAHALNHCSYGNPTICLLCMDDLHVADGNIQLFSVAMVIRTVVCFCISVELRNISYCSQEYKRS